jgi:DNA-binding NtrC family response regulator
MAMMVHIAECEDIIILTLNSFLLRLGYEVETLFPLKNYLDEKYINRPLPDVVFWDESKITSESEGVIMEILKKKQDIQVIFLLNGIYPVPVSQALQMGVFWNLRKPFSLEGVDKMLRKIDSQNQITTFPPSNGKTICSMLAEEKTTLKHINEKRMDYIPPR